MPEHTTTVWTCTRCGSVEEVQGTNQPKDWIRVGFVNPPRASWTDKLTVLGDLCNDPDCQGLVVAFVHGDEDDQRAKNAEMRRMMAKLDAEEAAIETALLHPGQTEQSGEQEVR